jgi:hypothetical protein
MLGEWAYFVFLVQWLAGFAVAVTLMPGQWRGWTLLFVATPAIVAAGAGLAWLNRRLLEPLRDLVRHAPPPTEVPAPVVARAERVRA